MPDRSHKPRVNRTNGGSSNAFLHILYREKNQITKDKKLCATVLLSVTINIFVVISNKNNEIMLKIM